MNASKAITLPGNPEQVRLLQEQTKRIFLTVVEREIRTPMNALSGMLETLALSELNRKQASIVSTLQESANALQRIVEDLLAASKIESGPMQVRAAPGSLVATIQRVAESLNESASVKSVQISQKLDPAIAPVLDFDPFRIRQILFILLSNAIKLANQGQIEIRADVVEQKADTQRIRIEVGEVGVKKLPHDKSIQPAAANPELIAFQWLVETMGGSLTPASDDGRGARTRLLFEFACASDAAPDLVLSANVAGTSMPSERAGFRSSPDEFRVLVAEDIQLNQMVLKAQLDVLGYGADFADNGEQALAMWQSGRYGLVICDCQMPVMDGYSFTRKVREAEAHNPQLRKIPIIAYTAGAIGDVAANCQAAGMDYFLSKPVSLAALKRMFKIWGPAGKDARPADPEKTGAIAPVDREQLRRIVVGDPKVEQEVLAIYCADAQKDIASLNAAIDEGNLLAIAQVLGDMKGAAQTIAAKPMAAACERAEQAANSGADQAARAAILEVLRQHERLAKYLSRV
jgi:CheY-like chemotaxis protein